MARQQEERLHATSRLITMGEMASTLAHELNQPLAAIASYNTGCMNRLSNDQANKEELLMILGKLGKQAQRAGRSSAGCTISCAAASQRSSRST